MIFEGMEINNSVNSFNVKSKTLPMIPKERS